MSAVIQISDIINGALSAQFGSLPKIEIPGDNARLKECAEAVLAAVRDKGLYRRDSVVVVIYAEKQRLQAMEADAFRTWVERHAYFFKTRQNDQKEYYEVSRTLPKEAAVGILASWDFWPELNDIEQCHFVPLPVLTPQGFYAELPEGYSAESKTLTFKI